MHGKPKWLMHGHGQYAHMYDHNTCIMHSGKLTESPD